MFTGHNCDASKQFRYQQCLNSEVSKPIMKPIDNVSKPIMKPGENVSKPIMKQNYNSYRYIYIYIYIYKGNSPITDPLLIPTPSRISVTINDIKILYIHAILVI